MGAPIVAAGAARAGVAARAGAGTKAAGQRAAIDAIKAKRPAPAPQPAPAAAPSSSSTRTSTSSRRRQAPEFLTNQRGAPAVFRTDGVRAANAGGGVVLGGLLYVVGLTYLRGGKAEVRRLLRAKFFNEVSR